MSQIIRLSFAATVCLMGLFIALVTPVTAQNFPLVLNAEALWLATPDPEDRGQFQGAAPLADGGALLVGRTGGGNTQAWAVRVDADGQVLWSRNYGGNADDYFEAAAALPDGRMIAVGRTNEGGTDALAIALNPDGTVAWQQTYGGSSMDLFQDVHVTPDGRVFAAGSYTLWQADRRDGWIAELDPSNGDVIGDDTWGQKQTDLDKTDLIYGIAEGPTGMVMAGASEDTYGYRLGAIVDLDADGKVLPGVYFYLTPIPRRTPPCARCWRSMMAVWLLSVRWDRPGTAIKWAGLFCAALRTGPAWRVSLKHIRPVSVMWSSPLVNPIKEAAACRMAYGWQVKSEMRRTRVKRCSCGSV